MTTWYSLDIADDVAAKRTLQRIMDAFTPKYIGAGRPLSMAIFSSNRRESNGVTLYFSPKAVSLAMQFGAAPCESTFVDQELSLLVGDERSINHLFPEAK
jgi:hypothetical protein